MNIISDLSFNVHAAELPTITKTNKLWVSTAAATANAIEGDPTLFIRAFGQKISEYFGFKYLNEDTLQVPNVSYFNSKIKNLNLLLKPHQKISLSFYETASGIETSESYLRNFASDISLPIAAGGTIAIHDTTYHFGGIFFPQVCLVSSLIQAELIIKFIDLLDATSVLRQHIIDEAVLNIDSALGNFSYCYLDRSEKLNSYWILSREGHNGKDYVNWFVRAICKKYEIEIPHNQLELFNNYPFSGVYKIDLDVNTENFYKITDARIKDLVESLQ